MSGSHQLALTVTLALVLLFLVKSLGLPHIGYSRTLSLEG